jgi:hypothetical protein
MKRNIHLVYFKLKYSTVISKNFPKTILNYMDLYKNKEKYKENVKNRKMEHLVDIDVLLFY